MAKRMNPTDRAKKILAPEREDIEERGTKGVGAPLGALGAAGLTASGIASKTSALGALGVAGGLGAASAIGAAGLKKARKRMDVAEKSISETLPKIDAAKAKVAAIRAAKGKKS